MFTVGIGDGDAVLDFTATADGTVSKLYNVELKSCRAD